MADVLDNGKYMLENLPGEVMRKAMETTNKLSQKGSFYYGTGGYETVTVGGNSYNIYQTTAMNPPTGSDGIYYLSIKQNGSDWNLVWETPRDMKVQRASDDGEGHTISSTYATKTEAEAIQTDLDSFRSSIMDPDASGTVQNASNLKLSIQDVPLTNIFESDKKTVKNATHANSADGANNVTTQINGKEISSIFESDGLTVKSATTASVSKSFVANFPGSTTRNLTIQVVSAIPSSPNQNVLYLVTG